VGFNTESQYWLDIEVFEEKSDRALTPPFQTVGDTHIADLEKTLELYKGDLLEGFYEDWVLRERERLQTLYIQSMIYLMQYYGFHGLFDKAIAYGQKILEVDPLREEIHREIMRLYWKNGQRAMSLRQYDICHRTLAEEFGVSPMEDTQALLIQIFTSGDSNRLPMISTKQTSLVQALEQLSKANRTIDLAKEQIQKALQLIANSSKFTDQAD
jgi:DNA-binding SARP family transcriptional activator